jgi:hypothetical protein
LRTTQLPQCHSEYRPSPGVSYLKGSRRRCFESADILITSLFLSLVINVRLDSTAVMDSPRHDDECEKRKSSSTQTTDEAVRSSTDTPLSEEYGKRCGATDIYHAACPPLSSSQHISYGEASQQSQSPVNLVSATDSPLSSSQHISYGEASQQSQSPVRLTPITGKPSRARRGVPAYVCEECSPPKVHTLI